MDKKIIDLPLHQDSATSFLPWLIGLMMYVIFFVTIIALALSFYSRPFTSRDLRVTLEVPIPPSQSRVDIEKRVLEALKDFPQISGVHPVSSQQIQTTILPWLKSPKEGEGLLSTLSFPVLIDIIYQKQREGDNTFLQELRQRFPGAALMVHEELFEHLPHWFERLGWIIWGSTGIFLTVALLAVVSSVRTGMAIHAPIVEILHLMGASEQYISRQFQRQTLKTTLKSFLLAGFLAVFTFIFLQFFFEGAAFSLSKEFYQRASLLLVLLPLISLGLILLTTRLTVMFSLRRSPF